MEELETLASTSRLKIVINSSGSGWLYSLKVMCKYEVRFTVVNRRQYPLLQFLPSLKAIQPSVAGLNVVEESGEPNSGAFQWCPMCMKTRETNTLTAWKGPYHE